MKNRREPTRLSKTRAKVENDLRGMSAKSYYAHKGMTSGLYRRIREALPANLWTKLDRGRLMTKGQRDKVVDALHRVMATDPWPYSWPDIIVKFVTTSGQIRSKLNVKVVTMPKSSSADGTLYFLLPEHPQPLVTADGFTGRVGFSSHAIDRMIARSNTREHAVRYGPTIVSALLSAILEAGIVEHGVHGPCLVTKNGGETRGYFPITRTSLPDGRDLWACKTFLEPGMRGAPES